MSVCIWKSGKKFEKVGKFESSKTFFFLDEKVLFMSTISRHLWGSGIADKSLAIFKYLNLGDPHPETEGGFGLHILELDFEDRRDHPRICSKWVDSDLRAELNAKDRANWLGDFWEGFGGSQFVQWFERRFRRKRLKHLLVATRHSKVPV